MEMTDQLALRAGLRVRKLGSLHLIVFSDAHSFIDACRKAKVLVLGIEGFVSCNGAVKPDLTTIADFSQLNSFTESIIEAREFIDTAGRPGMFFEFSLASLGKGG